MQRTRTVYVSNYVTKWDLEDVHEPCFAACPQREPDSKCTCRECLCQRCAPKAAKRAEERSIAFERQKRITEQERRIAEQRRKKMQRIRCSIFSIVACLLAVFVTLLVLYVRNANPPLHYFQYAEPVVIMAIAGPISFCCCMFNTFCIFDKHKYLSAILVFGIIIPGVFVFATAVVLKIVGGWDVPMVCGLVVVGILLNLAAALVYFLMRDCK